MSYTTLHLVKHGGLEDYREFGNAFGSAMYIWEILAQRYMMKSAFMCIINQDHSKQLWNLANDPRLTLTERLLLATTFDKAMVKRENCKDLADHFDKFVEMYPPKGSVCSLPQQAEALRDLPECIGVCWTQTSVSDPWSRVGEDGESRSYDIDRDTDHYFIYDQMTIMKAGENAENIGQD